MKRRKGGRFGSLVFFIPVILVLVVIAYAVIAGSVSPVGTLTITAQSSGQYYPAVGLNATAKVGAHSGVTPFSLSLTEGTYTVTFATLPWYSTPAPRTADLVAGTTTFAVGVYDPLVRTVSISGDQFNNTRLTAMHGVTPVVWVNRMSQDVVLHSPVTGNVVVPAAQNFTYVFKAAGTFTFSIPASDSPELVIAVG